MRKTFAEAQQTRRVLLDAGIRVFARAGYRRATLDAVGRDAGLTRGAIYWHFKNKRDLFERILERQDERLNRLVESVLAAPGSPLQKLSRLLEAVIDNFYDHAEFREFIELTWYKLEDEQFGRVMDSKSAFVQKFLALLARLLRESRKAGEIRADVDVRLAAFHLSCLINGFYRLYHVAPHWARDKARTQRLFRDHLRTLIPDGSGKK
jgi:TetR/AcrR family transcriptional regulator, acrAB operon repressor